jgi:ABC-type glycerol-3-phosphate transport system substrate-binding protein
MRSKNWLTGLLALTLILMTSITACSGGDKGDSSTTEKPSGALNSSEEKITLRMMWWGTQSRHDVTIKAIELYEQLHPNIKIESEYSGWDGYWDKLATLSAAKNLPDIIQMDAAYLGDYANRNQLLDLADMSLPKIDANLMKAGVVNEKQYAIPAGKNAYGMVYNKELFEEYGIQEPKEGWTWDDYFALAREARTKLPKDKYFSIDMSRGELEYTAYQLAQGKGPLYVDGKLNLDQDTWLKWHNIWSEFREEGIAALADQSIADIELDAQFDNLVKGKIMIKALHAAQAGAYDHLMPGKIGVTSLPVADEAASWLKPTFFWTVDAGSKHAEESKLFIDWLLNDVEAGKLMKTERGTPVNDDVLNSIQGSLTVGDLLGKDMIEKVSINSQTFIPTPAGWSEFPKDLTTENQAIMFNKTTPEKAYDFLIKRGEELAANSK